MRNAIRQAIKDGVPALAEVYQPFMAGPQVAKPFAVVKFGIDSSGSVRNTGEQTVVVGLYFDRESYENVDQVYQEVRQALLGDLETSQGHKFSLDYRGSVGEDFYDSAFQAIGRMLRFTYAYVN